MAVSSSAAAASPASADSDVAPASFSVPKANHRPGMEKPSARD